MSNGNEMWTVRFASQKREMHFSFFKKKKYLKEAEIDT